MCSQWLAPLIISSRPSSHSASPASRHGVRGSGRRPPTGSASAAPAARAHTHAGAAEARDNSEHRGQGSGVRPCLGVSVERAMLERVGLGAALHHRLEPSESRTRQTSPRAPRAAGRRRHRCCAAPGSGAWLPAWPRNRDAAGPSGRRDSAVAGISPRPPAHHGTPVMPDEVETIGAEGIGNADDMSSERVELVG